MKSTLVGLLLAGATALTASTWHVEQGDIRVICPMTIGGSFEAKTSSLTGSLTARAHGSGPFDGSLAVDLRTLDTGIGLRNEHLRENYLEVGQGQAFEKATLSEIQLKGLDPAAPQGTGSFSGLLTLHGVTQQVTGAVEVRRAGTRSRVTASFSVNLADYRIRKPRYLGVGVKDTVRIEVAFDVAGPTS